jgi:hypothetical protein
VTIADLNGDGKLDVVADIGNAIWPTVFLADANGDFQVGTSNPKCIGGTTVVRDWNGDGFPDLVNLKPTLSVCLNQGNGTFSDAMDCVVAAASLAVQSFSIESLVQAMVIADFNRDGHQDLAIPSDRSVDVLLGMGGCQFQPMTEYPLTGVVKALVSGDVNGDGLLDLVAATDDGTISLLLGGPGGAFQAVPFSVGGTLGFAGGGSLVVGDFTGDGKADIVFVPAVTYLPNSTGADVQVGGGPSQILENTCP